MSQGTSGYTPSTQVSPFHFLACVHCRKTFHDAPNPEPFYATNCSHTLCSTCLFPPPSLPPDSSVNIVTCAHCQERGRFMRLDPSGEMEGLRHCFRPVRELLDELGMSVEYQFSNVVEQLGYYKDKCEQQRRYLQSLAGDVKRLRAIESHAEVLEAENSHLRSQLEGLMLPPESRSDSRGQEQTYRGRQDISPGPRRPAARSAPQSHSTSRQHFEPSLPLQPARLSLSPATMHAHSARELQSDLQRARSNSSRPNSRQEIERSAKERIGYALTSEFLYDPTKGRPPSTPIPPRQPTPANSSRPSDFNTHQDHYYPAPPAPAPGPFRPLQSGSSQRTPFAPPPRGITPMPTSQRDPHWNQNHPAQPPYSGSAGTPRPPSRTRTSFRPGQQLY